MKLEFLENIKNNLDDKVQDFMNELSEHLENSEKSKQRENISYLREEDCLYYVIDSNLETVYLKNLNNNISFEEKDLPQELKSQLFTDCFLRYKNGEYIWEKDLTEKFWNTLVTPKELEEIKEKFKQESKIQENSPNTKYKVLSHKEEFTILSYENETKTVKVPNALLPFGVDNKKVYIYKDGKFELCI